MHTIAAQGLSRAILARQELEETWRKRLEHSHERYRATIAEHQRLLREESDGHPPSPDSALAQARQVESDALREYSRLLRIFTDLTIDGKVPDERDVAFFEGLYAKNGVVIPMLDDDQAI